MIKQVKYSIKNKFSEDQKYLIEAEIEVENGIIEVDINLNRNECIIVFDQKKISEDVVVSFLEEQKLILSKETKSKKDIKECTFYVKGMHCSSCEILIEKTITRMDGVKVADASAANGEIFIEYVGEKPSISKLNKEFKNENYHFEDTPLINSKAEKTIEINNAGKLIFDKEKINSFLIVFAVSVLLMIGFLFLNKSGIAAYVNVDKKSGLSMFFFFGLLAGFSSCAALVGGIVLSMSKQWMEKFSSDASNSKKMQPHIMFNVGRLVSYALLGGILGALGNFFQLSITFSSLLVLAVSIMMIFLAFQMLGFEYFQRFQLSMPKFITRYIVDESNFNGKYTPFTMGALTFFLPCGFTITAQGLALVSGNMLSGALIMFMFALGTVPSLMLIGFSSITFTKKPHVAARFMKVAGTLVLFFAIFNINAQLNVLGYNSLEDISFSINNTVTASSIEGLPPMVDGIQILDMIASASGYSPNKLKVRLGVPVKWVIKDIGTSGCTNAVISKGLFEGQVSLTPGQTSVKEFTPNKAGRYKFSCWMGMVSGSIEVIDMDKKGDLIPTSNEIKEVPSGASGCGCGGGGKGGSCGGA